MRPKNIQSFAIMTRNLCTSASPKIDAKKELLERRGKLKNASTPVAGSSRDNSLLVEDAKIRNIGIIAHIDAGRFVVY